MASMRKDFGIGHFILKETEKQKPNDSLQIRKK